MFFLIGHRGVGKTTLTSKIEGGLDLDQQISLNADINSYFDRDDEKSFRTLEKQVLKKIIDDDKAKVVALGAGFELDDFDFPDDSKFIWIQRRSDKLGRVFLNRPKLNRSFGPLEDYFSRYHDRQILFGKTADVLLEMVEGAPASESLKILSSWFERKPFFSSKAYYTPLSVKDLEFYSGRIELRTDLLSELEITTVLKTQSQNQYLVAIRGQVSPNFMETILNTDCSIDLPLENKDLLAELINTKDSQQFFVSSHEHVSEQDLSFCKSKNLHLKWAPVIKSFTELKKAFKLVERSDVSFLPRSENEDAKWKWIRESLFSKNKINFYRTGMTQYLDQILAQDLEGLESCSQSSKAAVIGENVFLSRSPGFHSKFFIENFKSFYSSVPMERDEFNKENLNFIKSLGYEFLSITAPFKKDLGFLGCSEPLNTVSLFKDKNKFKDTDSNALKFLVAELKNYKRPLIWGSGAMGDALKALLGSKSELMSVRSYDNSKLEGFDALVWCAGAEARVPLFNGIPSCVFDLEYKEHSKAKQVAFLLGTQYISGEKFFVEQARAQQKFWLKTQEEKR